MKSVLLEASDTIKYRSKRHKRIMLECVKRKLDNSLSLYESNLEDTCRYIMIRNPVVITREMHQVSSGRKRKDENNDERR